MNDTQEPYIALRGVQKAFRIGAETIPIFSGLDLSIARGDFVAVMGPSGSGKSTLLNMLGGLDSPDAGEIRIGRSHLEQMGEGARAAWRAHGMGIVFQFYNLLPMLKGEVKSGPRDSVYYFDQGGNLNAIRWNDWKLSFAVNSEGNIATATREVPAWASIANLRMDPYERGLKEGGGAIEFLARNMWLIVPVQGKIKEFFSDFNQYPYQEGSSLNASGINYSLLRQEAALKRLNDLERLTPQ